MLGKIDIISAAIATLASMDRDRFLQRHAEANGAEATIRAAESLGLDSRRWQAERADRERWVTQHSTTTLRYGRFDADETPEVMKLLHQTPMASMDEINAVRQRAIAEHEASFRQIGPGAFPADPPRAPVQVSRRSANPAAQFNADAGTAVPAKSSPRSRPRTRQGADPMPTSIKIKPSVMLDANGEEVEISNVTLTAIMDTLAEYNPDKVSRNELSSLALSRTKDRSSASSWIEALAEVMAEKDLTTEPRFSEPVGIEELMLAELTARAGNVIEDEPASTTLTPEQAADEVARYAAMPKSGIDLMAAARATLHTPGLPAVGFTGDREYDEPATRSAEDSEAEILRLTRGPMFGTDPAEPSTDDEREILRLTTQEPDLALYFASTDAVSDTSQATHGNAGPDRLCVVGHAMGSADKCPECGSGEQHEDHVDSRTVDQVVADSLARNESYFHDSRQDADVSGNLRRPPLSLAEKNAAQRKARSPARFAPIRA